MGALSGVIGDTADAYRMRILNIAIPQLFGAVGVTLGSAAYGHGWWAVAALTGIALVSGMISTIGAVASVSGLLLLLNSVIGAGLPLPGAWWVAPVLMSGGGLSSSSSPCWPGPCAPESRNGRRSRTPTAPSPTSSRPAATNPPPATTRPARPSPSP